MTPAAIEREVLHIACLVVGSALHFLPDDPALRGPADTARDAARLTATELRNVTRPAALSIAKQTLANGLAPLAERGFDLRRLYTLATVGKLNCGPLEGKEANAHALLLRFACDTVEAALRLLHNNQFSAKAVCAALHLFVDAETQITREAQEDWPAMRRRLADLDDALAGLGKHGIDLQMLGVRRDYATDKERAIASRRAIAIHGAGHNSVRPDRAYTYTPEAADRTNMLLVMRLYEAFAARALRHSTPPQQSARAAVERLGNVAAETEMALLQGEELLAIRARALPRLAQALMDLDATDIVPNDILSFLLDRERPW